MRGPVKSRRELLIGTAGIAAASALPALASQTSASESSARQPCLLQELSLEGQCAFRLDPDGSGAALHWYQPELSVRGWTAVVVPHPWQVMQGAEEYRG